MSEQSRAYVAQVDAVGALLVNLGGAWRGDWSGFDGRTLRDEMDEASALLCRAVRGENVLSDLARYRREHGLCPQGGSHWTTYCADYGCAAASDDDRA